MVSIETGNMDNGNSSGRYLDYYTTALDNGWRVAPTNGQDNHSLSTNSHRTVYIGPELSRAGLLDALAARRIYSSDDSNMAIIFKQGAAWMGSVIAASGQVISFFVNVVDDEAISRLKLVSNNGVTADEHTPSTGATSVTWTPEITADGDYYYLQVESADGDIAVTAPFWID